MPLSTSRLANQRRRNNLRARARRRFLVESLEERRLLAVLAADGFETGNFGGGSEQWATGNWQVSGDATVRSDTSPANGSQHARLRRDTGDLQRTVDVTDFTDIRLQFAAKLISLEGSDRADVKVSGDGATWTTLQSFGANDDDGQYKTYDLALPDVGNTLHIRFDAGMSGTADYWFIDDVQVTGEPAGPPEISISDAVALEGDSHYRYTDDFVPPDGSGLAAGRLLLVGSDERVYVVSRDTKSVKVFEGGTGEFLGDLAAPGVLDAPTRAMAFGPDGRLYVGGVYSDNILAFDVSDLTAPSTYDVYVSGGSGGLNGPGGLTFGPDGNLYVSSTTGGGGAVGPHEVLRFEGPNGASPGAPLPAPGKSGAVFVSDGDGNLSNPNQLVFGPDGRLYVASTWRDEIVRYNSTNGAFIDSFVAAGSGGLDTPNFITFRNDGLLYVGSQSTSQVLRYNASDGSFHDVFVTTPNGLAGFAFAASGDFYLSAGSALGTLGSSVRRYGPNSRAVLTVSLSQPSSELISVLYATADLAPSSAVGGVDYASAAGTLIFAPGQTSRTILIPTLDDTELEGTETFTVILSNPTGGAELAADHVGEAQIIDDDASREYSISPGGAIEGGSDWSFADSLAIGPAGVQVWTGHFATASNGDMFASYSQVIDNVSGLSGIARIHPATGQVQYDFVPLGTSGLSKVWALELHDGWIYASNKTTNEILRFDETTGAPDPNGAFGSAGAGGLIEPRGIAFDSNGNLLVSSKGTDEILKFRGSDGQFLGIFASGVTGGGTGPKDLARDSVGNLYVAGNEGVFKYAADGTASGSITIPGIVTSGLELESDQILFVSDNGNHRVYEVDVTTGNTLSQISFDASYGQPGGLGFDKSGNLYIGTGLTEGNVLRYARTSSATFTINLSTPSDLPVTVDFTTSPGTATEGSDYTPVSGTLVFEPGVTSRTIIVPTIDDEEVEDIEFFNVTLSNPVGGVIPDPTPAQGSILDNDATNLPPLVFAGDDQTLNDDDGNGSEEVTLSGLAFDQDGFIASAEWTLDGNVLGTEPILVTSLPVGVHTITLTATDNEGASGFDTVVITVLANQAPTASAGDDQSLIDADGSGTEPVTLVGTGSDLDGTVASYEWKNGDNSLGNTATLVTELPVGTHTLTLIVTDNGGATGTDTMIVTVDPAPSEVVLFEDSFEIGGNSNDWNGKWVEDSQDDFFRSTQRATDGSRSAEVDGWAFGADIESGHLN